MMSGFREICRRSLLALTVSLVLSNCVTQAQESNPSSFLVEARKFEGRSIRRIEFSPSKQPYAPNELEQRIGLRVGSAFHIQELDAAIQKLYASGRYADLAVDAADAEGGGVTLRFLTKPAYFVGHIAIYGAQIPPNVGQLYGSTKLKLGAPYAPEDRETAAASMENLLRANGFYRARIDTAVDYATDSQEASLIFNIEPGPRSRFESPSISGDPERSYPSIVRATGWKRIYGLLGWQPVTDARVQQGLTNIRKYYQKRDLFRSQVELDRLDYHSETNTVQPVVSIKAGPKVRIRVEGANISRSRLHQLVPIFQERSVDSDLLAEAQRNLRGYLQSQGYFGAQISYTVTGQSDEKQTTITYKIDRGDRHKFVRLAISGNRYFTEQTIRERLYEVPAEFPRFPHGRFSQEYLQQDLQAIDNLYRSNGFRNVVVTHKIVDDYGSVGHLALFIDIKEGPQFTVASLSVEGLSPAEQSALQDVVASATGQPFSETNVVLDRTNYLNYFFDQGYINATFEYSVQMSSRPNEVDLRYVIRRGERKFVRNVLITGLETTRRRLVTDRIGLKPGQPLSLTEETASQRRLYDLGVFARVNTALQNPDGEEDTKTVLYDFDEARHYSLNVGVGAQIARIGGGVTTLDNPAGTTGFSPRLAVGITRENLLGVGQTLGLQTSVSTIEQRAALTYFIPQFVSHQNLSLTTTLLFDNSNDIRTFTAHRREVATQLGQRLSRAYTIQYRLVFRHVTQSNLKIDPLLVPLLAQPEQEGLAEVSLIQDKRDDPTDAHHGTYTTIDVGYAPGFLGSKTEFARALFRNSTYYQVSRDLVFARSTQFGVISRTGGVPSIPLAERLYSGGSTSIRAFPDFQAGPRDEVTGFPIGGNALFINNLELRFPLYGDNLRGVIFHDAGNVYDTLSDFNLRFRQENLQDFNYLVQNVGLGVRYQTPIGPVRVDLSFSPDAPRFFGLKGTLQDYINGTAVSTVQKINAFQFHISLGQAF
jgi:outer membrane protein insertion porin family